MLLIYGNEAVYRYLIVAVFNRVRLNEEIAIQKQVAAKIIRPYSMIAV